MPRVADRGSSQARAMYVGSAIDDAGLDPYQFRVYAHLKRRAGDGGTVWEGQGKMAAICGMGRKKVGEVLTWLEENKWIEQEGRNAEDGATTTNMIYLLEPPLSLGDAGGESEGRRGVSLGDAAKGIPIQGSKDKRLAEPTSAPQLSLFAGGNSRIGEEEVSGQSSGGDAAPEDSTSMELIPPQESSEPASPPVLPEDKKMTPENERKQHFAVQASQRKGAIKTLKEMLGEKYEPINKLIKHHGLKPETALRNFQSTPSMLIAYLDRSVPDLLSGLFVAVSRASNYRSGYESNVGYQFFNWLTKPMDSTNNKTVKSGGKTPYPALPFPSQLDPEFHEKMAERSRKIQEWMDENKS